MALKIQHSLTLFSRLLLFLYLNKSISVFLFFPQSFVFKELFNCTSFGALKTEQLCANSNLLLYST